MEKPEDLPAPRSKSAPRRSGGPGAPGGPGPGDPPPSPGIDRGGRGGSRPNSRRRSGGQDTRTRTDARPQQGAATAGQRNWREQDLREREQRLSRSGGYFRSVRRDSAKRASGPTGSRAKSALDLGGSISVTEPLTIKALSAESGVKARGILRWLVSEEHDVTMNSTLDHDVAIECMLSFGVELEVVEAKTAEQQIAESFTDRDMKDERPTFSSSDHSWSCGSWQDVAS